MCPADAPTSRYDLGVILKDAMGSEAPVEKCLQSSMESAVVRPLNLCCRADLEFLTGLRAALTEIAGARDG